MDHNRNPSELQSSGSTIQTEIAERDNLGATSADDDTNPAPSVDPEMVKVFDQAAKYMEDTWKKAGSPTNWPPEKWDGLTNGALSRMMRLVVLSAPQDEPAKQSGPALVGTDDKADDHVPSNVNVQSQSYDYLFKIVIAGESGVGKSSLQLRYTGHEFNPAIMSTIAVDFNTKTVNLENGKTVKAQIWDTAGSERFRPITASYYRGAAGMMLVYDICNSWTFNNLPKWLEEWRRHGQENSVLMLVGNKSDRSHSRTVSTEEAKAFAVRNGLLFAEVSANDASNLESAFLMLLTEIFRVKVGTSN